MTEEKDEWWAAIPGSVKFLVIMAVLGGAGGNINSLTKTDDRFRGADFKREIAIRDQRIRELEQTQQAHLRHSARYTEIIDELRRDFEAHMRAHK